MINQPLDFYDDPEGSVLKKRVSDYSRLPDFVKTAEQLSADIRNQLPDDVYALVMLDSGQKMRKYACTDKGNTTLSVIYFLENKDRLPIEAQKTAAANLVTACGWYDMEPPERLVKLSYEWGEELTEDLKLPGGTVPKGSRAMHHGGKIVGYAGRTGGRIDPNDPRSKMELQALEHMKKASVEKIALIGAAMNVLGAVDAAKQGKENLAKMKARLGESGAPQSQEPMKVSELTGSDVMPYSPEPTKKASLHPHVDVTGLRAPQKVEHKQASQHFCLIKEGSAKYPIDTATEVEKAAEYFVNYGDRFTPFERHRYCTNLTKRAEALGMKMPDVVRKYGSAGYDPNVKLAVAQRRRFFHEGTSEYGLVNELMDKCAAIIPETFAVMLEQFDRQTGLADRWGNGVDDPYFSVFGFTKQANWSFTYANDHVNEDQLRKLSTEPIRREQLKRRFGCDMVEEFEKDPIKIFDSLPLEHKRILMHMASGVEE